MDDIGIWNRPDRLGDSHPGMSPYHYVLNNPMRYTDPFGTQAKDPNERTTDDLRDYVTNVVSRGLNSVFNSYNENVEPQHPGNSLEVSPETLKKSKAHYDKNNNSVKEFVQEGHRTLDEAGDILFWSGTSLALISKWAPPVATTIMGISYTGSTYADFGSLGLKTIDAIFYTNDWSPVISKFGNMALTKGFEEFTKILVGKTSKMITDNPKEIEKLIQSLIAH